jgi:hypothetical protein
MAKNLVVVCGQHAPPQPQHMTPILWFLFLRNREAKYLQIKPAHNWRAEGNLPNGILYFPRRTSAHELKRFMKIPGVCVKQQVAF